MDPTTTTTTLTLGNLPDDVALEIFSHLPAELYGKIAQINTKFHDLVFNQEKVLKYDNYRSFLVERIALMNSEPVDFISEIASGFHTMLSETACAPLLHFDSLQPKPFLQQFLDKHLGSIKFEFLDILKRAYFDCKLTNQELSTVANLVTHPGFKAFQQLAKCNAGMMPLFSNIVQTRMTEPEVQEAFINIETSLSEACKPLIEEQKKAHDDKYWSVNQELLNKVHRLKAIPVQAPLAGPVAPAPAILAPLGGPAAPTPLGGPALPVLGGIPVAGTATLPSSPSLYSTCKKIAPFAFALLAIGIGYWSTLSK